MIKNILVEKNKYLVILFLSSIFLIGLFLAIKKYTSSKNENKIKIQEKKTEIISAKLFEKDWVWVESHLNDSQKIKPRLGLYTIKFNKDGKFTTTSDCNNISGKFEATEKSIIFKDVIVSTKFCPKSLESNFVSEITQIRSYYINENKELILNIADEKGYMIFK